MQLGFVSNVVIKLSDAIWFVFYLVIATSLRTMGEIRRGERHVSFQLCLAVSDVIRVRSVLLDGFYNLCFFGYLLNHYMWSTCIIILLYEAYIFIKFVTHEFFRSTHSMSDDEEHWMGDAPVFTCSLWVTKSSLLCEDTQMFWRKDARYYQLFGDYA